MIIRHSGRNWSMVVPPYPLIQYPRFTAARKKIGKLKNLTVHKFQKPPSELIEVKGKAIPLHAWTGTEGSRKLRLPDFKTIGT
jgi:hypothetical protein